MSHSTSRRTVKQPPPHSHTHIDVQAAPCTALRPPAGPRSPRTQLTPLHTYRTAYHFPATAHAIITSYTHTHKHTAATTLPSRYTAARPHTTPLPIPHMATRTQAHIFRKCTTLHTPATYLLSCTDAPTQPCRGSPSSRHTSQHVRAGPWTSPSQPQPNTRQHSPNSTTRPPPNPNKHTRAHTVHARTHHAHTNNHRHCHD